MSTDPKLSEEFRKSRELEETLRLVNEAIHGLTLTDESFLEPSHPVILLMGSARSGTTLFFQWLRSSGLFGYPSNLISRFYGNPGFGAAVQKMLVDLDKEGQIGLKQQPLNFESRLGRSMGAMAPSEFWYFWRRYFTHDEIHQLSPAAMAGFDREGFLEDLASLESELGLPLAMKGMIANFDIGFLADVSPRFLFVNIQRSLTDTIASILRSRVAYAGNEDAWWSFKPPGYQEWMNWSPVEQVAAQVLTTRKHIEDAFRSIGNNRYININYERFCEAPAEAARSLRTLLAPHGLVIPLEPFRERPYDIRRLPEDSAAQTRSIEQAISIVGDRLGIEPKADDFQHA